MTNIDTFDTEPEAILAAIRTLRAESAAGAGDLAQSAICAIALGEEISEAEARALDAQRRPASEWTQTEARAECLRALADAAAMLD